MNEKTKKYLDRINTLNEKIQKSIQGVEKLHQQTIDLKQQVESWKKNLPEKKTPKKVETND